jgi:hypothetical protein
MKLAELPLDTWVVVEPVAANEVILMSTHATQSEAEIECANRNYGLGRRRFEAVRALAPIASAQGCAASPTPCKRTS